jgi:predicted ATP-grasp superfamily ATP-dependent carboligase
VIKAVVFGRFETGLSIMRSLGLCKIDFISIDYKKDVGWYSDFGEKRICPNPKKELELKVWIKGNFNGVNKPLVFLSSDDFLSFFSKYRSFSEQYFELEIPSSELIDSLQNKYFQYSVCLEHDINAPITYLVNNELNTAKLSFPAFIKGLDVNIWRAHFGGTFKGFVVNNIQEFQSVVASYSTLKVPTIIQELIVGPDENNYKYCAYRNKQGDILAEFMLQKLIQFPKGYGIGAAVKSIYDEDLLEQGRRLFHGINYFGVGSAEFKRDEKDGKFKLIELNPRYWQQNFLATQCGVNFPIIQLANREAKLGAQPKDYSIGYVWLNRLLVARALMTYLKEDFQSFKNRLLMLKGKKVYSHQFKGDQNPFLVEAEFGLVLIKLPFVLLKVLLTKIN